MATTITDPYERIIWSADVADERQLFAAIDELPDLKIIKIDRLFLEGRDLSVIRNLKNNRGLQVFDDAKIVEIPSKLEAVAKKHLTYKPWMLNCMAGSLSSCDVGGTNRDEIDGLKRFADACHEAGTKPCGVTVLTSKTPSVVSGEFNGRDAIEQVLFYVDMLRICGFTDVVCSPQEVAAIRAESRFDCLDLNTPGIRPADAAMGDQARAATPAGAIAAGATRLVIGRPITTGVPADNLRAIAESIAS
jgi:orotidine-5'-phosphate decarboxylase